MLDFLAVLFKWVKLKRPSQNAVKRLVKFSRSVNTAYTTDFIQKKSL